MCQINIVLVTVVLLLSGCTGLAKKELIYPGVNAGAYFLNKTTNADIKGQEEGVFLTFNQGKELTSIVVTSNEYETTKGIAVGDSVEAVFKVYGDVRGSDLDILKGNRTIGSVGQTLNYPGIKFLINEGVVTGIIIVPI